MVTLRSIADRCGVDVSTVSKVIHGKEIRVAEDTRNKILAAAKELKYRPNALARSLRLRLSTVRKRQPNGTARVSFF
jgi:LacI family transcriptional regulator